MKQFVEQISIKFGGFYLIKMKLVQTVLQKKAHQNIGENLNIGRYSKGQLSADNIGGLIYRSVSTLGFLYSRHNR